MFETFVNVFPETSVDTLAKIEAYYQLLLKWNKALNLVQKDTIARDVFEHRHLIDCWQLTLYLDRTQRVLDVGSGAGLPGILLAIAGYSVDLVELDTNKSSFLKNCKTLIGLDCSVLTVDVYSIKQPYSQVTSRAFSQLSKLLEIQSNVSRETKGVFLKGSSVDEEITDAGKFWSFNLEVKKSLSASEGNIVIVENLVSKEC